MSNDIFSIGEIAIIHYADGPSAKNGEEVEIFALAQPMDYESPITGKLINAGKFLIKYRGDFYQCWPKHLRKRRPPDEPSSRWDDVIVWKPREVEHV
jgi:hypothetical protein